MHIMQPAVYIMANHRNGTLYTGVTSDLIKRVYEHKTDTYDGCSKKYGCKQLVFYELYETMDAAIHREKQIKKGSRKHKLMLIEAMNLEWKDLHEDIT
ncbi:MAG: GIY-YIG nuclease family protein [Alphaproteobacteria bacterium]|nr:GIY-YIG nuclease family protein [Alphaproteobacteria bacterium]